MINLKIENLKDLAELKKAKETSQGLVGWKTVRKKLVSFSKRPLSEIKLNKSINGNGSHLWFPFMP